jgi:hypothetical protein
MNQQHAQDLLKAEKERAELLTEQYRKDTERLRGQVDELSGKWACCWFICNSDRKKTDFLAAHK